MAAAMSDWLRSSLASVAGRSGAPAAKLTIARRVHVMWSSHSLRMPSCRRAARTLRVAAALAAAWGSWRAAAAGAAGTKVSAPAAMPAVAAARARAGLRRRDIRELLGRCPRLRRPAGPPYALGRRSAGVASRAPAGGLVLTLRQCCAPFAAREGAARDRARAPHP